MPKIGLDLRFWRSGTGGLGRYSRNLLSELLKIDHEYQYTAIITPDDLKEFELEAPNLKKIVVNIPHFSPKEQTQLLSLLNKENFDLVHFANFNHPILYRKPFIVTVHDLIMHLFPSGQQKGSPVRHLAYKLTMSDCRRAEKILVPSQCTKKDLVEMLNFPKEKIAVTLEGSEAGFRLHDEKEKKAIREKLQLPNRYLLFVSRWEKYKGIDTLIEAYEILRTKYKDLGLVICGRPDKQNPEIAGIVKEKQAQGERIVTPGFISDEDLMAVYSAATVYVHPSLYEGFGIMILEAFNSGTPVVTSNTSSLPEVVGDAGLLVTPGDPKELAKQINKVLSDPDLAEELVRKGVTQAKHYSWAKMAKETLEIYKEVLEKK